MKSAFINAGLLSKHFAEHNMEHRARLELIITSLKSHNIGEIVLLVQNFTMYKEFTQQFQMERLSSSALVNLVSTIRELAGDSISVEVATDLDTPEVIQDNGNFKSKKWEDLVRLNSLLNSPITTFPKSIKNTVLTFASSLFPTASTMMDRSEATLVKCIKYVPPYNETTAIPAKAYPRFKLTGSNDRMGSGIYNLPELTFEGPKEAKVIFDAIEADNPYRANRASGPFDPFESTCNFLIRLLQTRKEREWIVMGDACSVQKCISSLVSPEQLAIAQVFDLDGTARLSATSYPLRYESVTVANQTDGKKVYGVAFEYRPTAIEQTTFIDLLNLCGRQMEQGQVRLAE